MVSQAEPAVSTMSTTTAHRRHQCEQRRHNQSRRPLSRPTHDDAVIGLARERYFRGDHDDVDDHAPEHDDPPGIGHNRADRDGVDRVPPSS